MATANHPENQQTQGGTADLGQISTDHASDWVKPFCPYCGNLAHNYYSNTYEEIVCCACFDTWSNDDQDAFFEDHECTRNQEAL